jgi:hypothetical protein
LEPSKGLSNVGNSGGGSKKTEAMSRDVAVSASYPAEYGLVVVSDSAQQSEKSSEFLRIF